MQNAKELLHEIIKLNKGKSRELSNHLLVLAQQSIIFKDTTNELFTRVNVPNAPTVPSALHLPTDKDVGKTTPQTHQ